MKGSDGYHKVTGVQLDLVTVLMVAAFRYWLCTRKTVRFTEGLRSRERQRALVKAKKSWTTRSYHLVGKAIDTAILEEDGRVLWDLTDYKAFNLLVQQVAAEFGVEVTWGGNWDVVDGVHFQLETL